MDRREECQIETQEQKTAHAETLNMVSSSQRGPWNADNSAPMLDHKHTHAVPKMLSLDKELCPPNKKKLGRVYSSIIHLLISLFTVVKYRYHMLFEDQIHYPTIIQSIITLSNPYLRWCSHYAG